MNICGHLWGVIGLLIVLAGCGKGGEADGTFTVAVVNGHAISAKDLEREASRLPDPQSAEGRGRALQALIDRRLLMDEAEKAGITRLPDLQAQWTALVIDRLLKDRMAPALEVTEAEADDFYRKNASVFVIPESRRLRQIVTAEEWEAEKTRESLKNGGDFAQLAQDHSLEPFSVNDGDLGYIMKAGLVPEFAAAAFSLSTGEFSPPLRTRFGYHVLEVLDIRPSRRKSFAESSDVIREYLVSARRKDLVGRWIGELRSAAEIELAEGFSLLAAAAPPPGKE